MDFLKNLESKHITKGTILLSPGQVCNAGFRVKKGCLKSYVIDNAGKEHILQFAPEEWLISDLESFTNRTPCRIFIDAVEDSEVYVINRENLTGPESASNEALFEMNNKYRNNLIATHNRLISLLSGTAEERYLEFTETYPALIQRLPLKLIASYLGMTAEHLSYSRGKLARKR